MHGHFLYDGGISRTNAPPPVVIQDGGGPIPHLREWSSVIGIVTAIIGNILISFALNTQRYAHIRIDREYHDGRDTKDQHKSTAKAPRSYGALEQERIAEERSKINAEAPGPDNEDDAADETGQPLHDSFDSDETLTDAEKDDQEEEGRKSYLKSGYWWIGIIMMTVGEAGNFLAYGFAPASIVSPLGVVALVSNCLIAPFMLKERFRQRDFWGVIVAIAGAVTVVLSAKTSETKLGPDDLWYNIKRWEFLAYVLITIVFIIALMFASPKYGKRTILIDLGLVGLFGGYTALSTKGVASLLSGSLYKAFTFPITYFLVLVLVVSAVMQIRYLNRALQIYDSTQVIPTQFVLFTLSVIIGSAVLYRDFESTTADKAIKFVAGCLLTFFGVYLITSGRKFSDDNEDEEGSPDERIRLVDDEANQVGTTTPTKAKPHSLDGPRTPDLRPSTPDRLRVSSRRSSKASSEIPSIAVTPAETPADINSNPWLSSTDHLDNLVKSKSQPQAPPPQTLPKTPQITRIQSQLEGTPYFTPSTSNRPSTIRRTASSTADPETPTRGSRKRSNSPPKASRPPVSPHPTLRRSARESFNRLLPGPLLPPLSSSLSAVVADSLLKGEGSPRSVRAIIRRNRSIRGGGASTDDQLRPAQTGGFGLSSSVDEESALQAHEISRQNTRETLPSPNVRDAFDGDFDVQQSGSTEGDRKKGRLRSMSETLAGLISGGGDGRGTTSRGKRRDDADDRAGDGDSNGNGSRRGSAER